MIDAVEHNLGDVVYHRCDADNEMGMVTGILFRPSGHIFLVTWGRNGNEAENYACEISKEPFNPPGVKN